MPYEPAGRDGAQRLTAAVSARLPSEYLPVSIDVGRTSAPSLRVDVVDVYPHDAWAFTEGLAVYDDVLYESTGGYDGFSSLRVLSMPWGRVRQATGLNPAHFGEGLAILGARAVQLTYREGAAIVYDIATLQPIETFTYTGEGWGLAFDGRVLVMSNGSNTLTLRDPNTFAATGTIAVTVDGEPVDKLNELECVGDRIYANVFPSGTILEIGRDGRVTGVVDASALLTSEEKHCLAFGNSGLQRAAVLNGIAYDTNTETFLLTGKLWPKVFRARFVPQKGA